MLPDSFDFLRWPSLHLTLTTVGFAARMSTAVGSFSAGAAELATNITYLLTTGSRQNVSQLLW